jgi:hypothetical protein
MPVLRLKLILAAVVFFLVWNFFLAPHLYSFLDSTSWVSPPIAFITVFLVYFGCFTLIFLGLVEGNMGYLRGSLTMGFLTSLGLLNIDIGESTIPIRPDGTLLTTNLGFKSDLASLYHWLWSPIIPKEHLYFFVMFVSPAIVFTLIILSLTTKQVRQYWQELRY